jgi:hypothetical protein
MTQEQQKIKLRPNITLDEKTYDRIRCFGNQGDTFADIINKALDVVEGTREPSSVIGHKQMTVMEFETRYGPKSKSFLTS